MEGGEIGLTWAISIELGLQPLNCAAQSLLLKKGQLLDMMTCNAPPVAHQ